MSGDPAQILCSEMATAHDDSEVARILDAYLADLEAGHAVDPARLLEDHPAIADQLRSCLEVMSLAGRMTDPCMIDPHAHEPGDRRGPRLGDYRIVRQVGRGGMGVVYEAEQLSLSRRVALKVLPLAGALDPGQLRRFRFEAQAAAQLHHTNIVPVYAVGCEGGVHFYAMQFIEGKSLAELIRELRLVEGRTLGGGSDLTLSLAPDKTLAVRIADGPVEPGEETAAPEPEETAAPEPAGGLREPSPADGQPVAWSSSSSRTSAYFSTVARMGIQAAQALQHAHQEGILHRDIKPANLMIDTNSHLWVTDFGLARLQHESGLTLSGELVGTIRYMSPEQALGRGTVLDLRSDIYALGATLYELLALQPAFAGDDRRELLRRIIEEEPRSLRVHCPSIPWELDTIVSKAMAKEPADRYSTAGELAEDLQRYLDYRPIKARRPTVLERAYKWVWRHTAVLIAAAILLAVSTAGLAVSAAVLMSMQREIQRQQDFARQEAPFLTTLGIALYRAGDMSAAISALARAHAMREVPSAIDCLFLAMAHSQLGHSDEAREWLDRADEIINNAGPPYGEFRRIRAEAALLVTPPKSPSFSL